MHVTTTVIAAVFDGRFMGKFWFVAPLCSNCWYQPRGKERKISSFPCLDRLLEWWIEEKLEME